VPEPAQRSPARPADSGCLRRRGLVHRVFEGGAEADGGARLHPVRDQHTLHHVVERGFEGTTTQADGHDCSAGITPDRADSARDPGRAAERRDLEAGGVRGGAEAAGGIGESQRGKAFHVSQHRAGL
jgi:hypothetical protein